MNLKRSTGLVEFFPTVDSVRAAFPGFEVRVYSGPIPADADNAATGTRLGKYDNGGSPATFAVLAPGGVLSRNEAETLSGTSVAAGGMTYFRLVDPGDDDGASVTAKRNQGDIGVVGSAMVVPTTVVSASGVSLPPITALAFKHSKGLLPNFSTGWVEHYTAIGSVRSGLPGFEVRVYGGVMPADSDDAIGGAVLLGKYNNSGAPATFAATSPGGVLSRDPSESLIGTSLSAGEMTFFRLVDPADDGSASPMAKRIQGNINEIGSIMVVPSTTIAAPGVSLPPVTALSILFSKG